MSATLTWYFSGAGTKTGTAIGNYFTDYKNLFDANIANADFTWEVAASSLAGTPYYLWLRRKDGSNGRILLISWSSGPAGNNSAILDTSPTTSQIYLAWFPNGTAASPSNLTASSGSISGDDTNCVKCSPMYTIASAYSTSMLPYYFDCEDGLTFLSGNPGSTQGWYGFVGDLAVDANDVAYGITAGSLSSSIQSFAGSSSPPFPFAAAGIAAGATSAGYIKSNYATQASNTAWYQAYMPSSSWASVAISSTDVLSDTANNDVWFVPIQLMASGIKGGGFPIKLRQIAMGPGSSAAFQTYQTSGPVIQARQVNHITAGNTGCPWLVNFKI